MGENTDYKKSLNPIRTVKINQISYQYEVLQVLEFDSNRKRMSIILRDMQKTSNMFLLCKGAESSIFKCIKSGDILKCDANIKYFSQQGWRTLALAYKTLTEREYAEIADKLKSAYQNISNRKELLAKAFNEIEQGLELIGSTAVEDKLQDKVRETIEFLRNGGIKLWVLTGDKKETAVNISISCGLFSKNMAKLDLSDLENSDSIESKIKELKSEMLNNGKMKNTQQKYALIIDGEMLANLLLGSSKLVNDFRDICMKCDSVLCFRMTPKQKADVVKLVKNNKNSPITAAIGDGANDVSMIQEANVGFGIYGKEGRNAAYSADFAFVKFSFLKRILFVHGFYFYTRSALMAQFFFYEVTQI